MEKAAAVSVLIAVYEPDLVWLEELLRSVAVQSYQDFEVRVLDDCSLKVDYSEIRGMCRRIFGNKEHVFIGRNEKNIGSDQTFEKLARCAQGKYLAFCDQDDIWEPQKLERLVNALEEEQAVLAYSDMSVMDGRGLIQYGSLRQMRPGLVFVHGRDRTACYIMDNCTAACSMLVRASAVHRAFPFPKGIYCDQWIAACAAAQGKIVFLAEPLVRYRRHGGNQTASFGQMTGKKDYFRERVLASCRFAEELRRRGIHYKYEKEIHQYAEARRHRDLRGIWKYRRFSRKAAFLDMMMLCLPDFLVKCLFFLRKTCTGCRERKGDIMIQRSVHRIRDAVPVVLAANRGYVPMLTVCIHSIAVHASASRSYHICIFHTDIPRKDTDRIERVFCTESFRVEFVDVSEEICGRRLKGKGLITAETYFRFLIPWLMRGYDKVVYLDADTVVCRDLADIYETDLKACLLAAVPEIDLAGQYHGANPDTRQYCDRVLRLKDPYSYFQAGVLLWNTAAWRKHVDIRRLFAMAEHGNYRYSDQDILNLVCEGRVLRLGMEWNVLTESAERKRVLSYAPDHLLEEYDRARQQPAIIHYAGSCKPWKDPNADFAQEFWKAARGTPYYEQLLYEMCRHAVQAVRPGLGMRIGHTLAKAVKRMLPSNSRARRAMADLYWKLK